MFIGFGNMGVDGDHCKRRFSGVVVVEARSSNLNCLMESEKVEGVFVDISFNKFH